MSSTSMASSSEYSTDSAIQTSVPPQRSTVHDLYGLVGVSTPNATETQIRNSYEAMVKKLRPQLPSKAAKAAFSVLTNPATRSQYDRDRLGYLYAHFKSSEVFPANVAMEKNESRENEIEVYAAVLKDHITDPVEEKKVKIHARLIQIRNELEEYKEKSKNVQEEWATSSNQILRMSANALREVEICARADIEMLENELGDLRGQLPPKNIDGPPGRIASGQYGSDMGGQNKSKSLLAVNQRPPSIPRSPTVPLRLRSASKLGVRIPNSSTGDSSSSTTRSDSTMAIDDRIRKYFVGSVYSPTFYAPATYLDPVKRQHDVERIIARAKRQSLDPETLSDLAMVKPDKLPQQVEKAVFVGFDPAAFPEYDPTIKQKKGPNKQHGNILKKDESIHRLANIGESSELSETQCECEAPNANPQDAEMSTSSESSLSTSLADQSPPGLGLVEYQERFGCHEITEDAEKKMRKEFADSSNKKTESAKKKLQKPWVSINDSLRMPAHLSSTRADLHASVQTKNVVSSIDRPDRPFQRTSRSVTPAAEFTPMGKLRTKPALSSIIDEMKQQEHKVAQPKSRKPSQIRDCIGITENVQAAVWESAPGNKTATETEKPVSTSRKEFDLDHEAHIAQEIADNVIKMREAAMHEALERSISMMKKEEAARTLIEMSRQGEGVRGAQIVGDDTHNENIQPSVQPQPGDKDGVGQYGSSQYGSCQYGTPEYAGGSQQSGMPYGYGLYQQPHTMYLTGPHTDPVLPTFFPRGFQDNYLTSHHYEPFDERSSAYGAIGSEVKALEQEKKTQAEKLAATEEKEREQLKAAKETALQASKLGRKLSVSLKIQDDPFAD